MMACAIRLDKLVSAWVAGTGEAIPTKHVFTLASTVDDYTVTTEAVSGDTVVTIHFTDGKYIFIEP